LIIFAGRDSARDLDCGGKRSATPLWNESVHSFAQPSAGRKRRRRSALQAQSKWAAADRAKNNCLNFPGGGHNLSNA
jgi:hypothetical protein